MAAKLTKLRTLAGGNRDSRCTRLTGIAGFATAAHGDVAWLFGGLPFEAKSEGYGLGLPGVYLVWMIVVALLYLPCRWFAEVKRRRSDGWLSYL
jgi:hypothetical protein